jgi:hypothetical protein
MARTLSLQVIATYLDDVAGICIPTSYSSAAIGITGNTPMHTVQNIGTTAETLAIGDITTPGWFIYKCLHATTNSILIGITTTSMPVRARAGLGFGVFEVDGAVSGVTIYAKATPAAADLEYKLLPL